MTTEAEGPRTRAVLTADAAAAQSVTEPAPRKRTREEIHEDAARARRELAATLDAIEDKLNVPKQLGLAAERTNVRVREFAAKNPVAFGAVALGAASVVGLGVWALVRAISRR